MKSLFILLLSVIIASNTNAQDILKFRAFQTTSYDKYTKGDLEWNDVNILVVLNTEKDLIRVFAKSEKNIDIITTHKKIINENGDDEYQYTGVDEDGIKCRVKLILFTNEKKDHKATMLIEYLDTTLVYRLKEN